MNGGMFGYSVATVTTRNNVTWLAIGEPWSSKVHIYTTPHTDVIVNLVNYTSTLVTCTNLKTNLTTTFVPSTSTTSSTTLTTQPPPSTTTSPDEQCTTSTTILEKIEFSFNVTATPLQWTLVQTLVDDRELESTGNAVWNGTSSASGKSLFGFDLDFSHDGQWLAIGTPGRTLVPFAQLGVKNLSWHPYHGSVMMYQLSGQQEFRFSAQLLIAQLGGLQPQYFDKFGSKLKFSMDTNPSRMFLFIGSNGGYDGVSKPGALSSTNGLPPIFGQQNSWPIAPTSSISNLGVGVFKYTTSSNTWTPVQFLNADTSVPLGTIGLDFDVSGTGALDTVVVVRGYTNSGTVVVYRQDVDRFVKVQTLSQGTDPWFGVGINVQIVTSQLAVLHVGSPKQNQVVRYVCKRVGIYDDWVMDGFRQNPVSVNVAGHNFFGGTQASNSRLVFLSDAAGASGRGKVFMYHRRTLGMAVSGFEDVLREQPTSTTSTFVAASLEYDYIGVLNIPSTQTDGIYNADQFGKAVSVSGNVAVVGAPVNGCVYTFAVPVSYPIPNFVNSVVLPNNTITQSPTPTFPPGERVSNDQTILYAIIGSVAGVVVFVPLAIYTAMRYHKSKLMNQLQAQAGSPTSQAPLTAGL